ncbi:MAG TPA: class I SAM-dependent methyltransferase [Pyrinomonadaceae bacterium]
MTREAHRALDYPIIESTGTEHLQKLHYDKIGKEYESHYGDPCSRQYRERFIHEPMFAGLELRGLDVLEAMCGNGQTTEFLLSKGARVTGLDISATEIGSFKQRWPDCKATCASILNSGFASASFDCVATVGGLHHLHPHLGEAVSEIHRILKAGGSFCFAEPYQGSLPDLVRSFWYKHDSLFASNESSIDINALRKDLAAAFSFGGERYMGNIGYLLVLNSMVFRIPVRLKPLYSPIVMAGESFINRFVGKWSSCFVVCQWQKI